MHEKPKFTFNFPKTTFAVDPTTNWCSQLEHFLSEADELAVEFKKWKRTPIADRNNEAIFDEFVDMLQSGETLVHKAGPYVHAATKRVIAKNEERGYYDRVPGPDFGSLKNKGISEGEPPQVQEVSIEGVGTIHLHTGPQPELPGGSTPSQYAIPEGTVELQDLIEHREMNFADGNIFKAVFRKGNCSHSDELRDARKVLWFAQREVERLEKEPGGDL